jgi:hypothetical protein
LAAAVLACSLPAAAAAATSPSKVLDSILAAARAQGSVHSEGTGNYAASHVRFVSDAGLAHGIQRITFRKGGETGYVTVIVAANTAYVRGDAFTLLNYMNFRRITAVNYAGRWVRFPGNDGGFSSIAAGVTLSSLIDGLELGGTLSSVSGNKIDGRRVFTVSGKTSSKTGTVVDTVYARGTGSPLPLKQVTTRGPKDVTTTIFSNWSGQVDVAVPKVSVSIAAIRKASPGVS